MKDGERGEKGGRMRRRRGRTLGQERGKGRSGRLRGGSVDVMILCVCVFSPRDKRDRENGGSR